jgi:hypothetical protein
MAKIIEMNEQDKLELICRVLLLEYITDGIDINKHEIEIDTEKLMNKANQISKYLFDDDYLRYIGQMMEVNNESSNINREIN